MPPETGIDSWKQAFGDPWPGGRAPLVHGVVGTELEDVTFLSSLFLEYLYRTLRTMSGVGSFLGILEPGVIPRLKRQVLPALAENLFRIWKLDR